MTVIVLYIFEICAFEILDVVCLGTYIFSVQVVDAFESALTFRMTALSITTETMLYLGRDATSPYLMLPGITQK